MFPPTYAVPPRLFAASESKRWVRVVVVVLPSLPVTAMTVAGVASQNHSISEVSRAPRRTASGISPASGLMPGERKMTAFCSSPPQSPRVGSLPHINTAPRSASFFAASPRASNSFPSRISMSAPMSASISASGRFETPMPSIIAFPRGAVKRRSFIFSDNIKQARFFQDNYSHYIICIFSPARKTSR